MSDDKITKILLPIILVIVSIIIIFSFVGDSSTELVNSANSITDANNCSRGVDAAGVTLFYNITDKFCYNTTPDATGGKDSIAGQFDLPLNTLFSSSGVVLLVLMAMLLVFVIVVIIKGLKGKK